MILQMGNKGAFIRFEAPDMKPNIVTFSAVVRVRFSNYYFMVFSMDCLFVEVFTFCHALILQPHPDVKPMAYANNFLRMFQ